MLNNKSGLTQSQYDLLESARLRKYPFLTTWKVNPLRDGRNPIINIEYSFNVPEEEFANIFIKAIKNLRTRYGIKKSRPAQKIHNDGEYDAAVRLRNIWIKGQYIIQKSVDVYTRGFRENNRNMPIYKTIQMELAKLAKKNPFYFPTTNPAPYKLSLARIEKIVKKRQKKTKKR